MKKSKCLLLTLLFFIAMSNTSICIEKNNILNKDILINNVEKDDIKISITDINIVEEKISVGDVYNSSAIISMNVKNNSKYDIELSNIDVYPYQGGKPVKYFVSTGNEDIQGFIGNIKGGEDKDIKMGITLHNTKDPIKLELNNIEDKSKEQIVHSINIK